MKKYTKKIGLILITIGTLLLVATQFAPFSSNNYMLLGGLLCNVFGIILLIRGIKCDSLY